MIPFLEGVHLKLLSQPRRKILGAALLLMLVLTSCGTPIAGDSWPGISTDGQFIYVAWKNHVLRVNPANYAPGSQPTDRRIDWLANTPDDKSHMYGPPAVTNDGTVYLGSFDHKVFAFTVSNKLVSTWT